MTNEQFFDIVCDGRRGGADDGWRQGFKRWLFRSLVLPLMRLRIRLFPKKCVLFAGQAYYNHWYLSRALQRRGWKADLLNWDANQTAQIYYHGEDFRFTDEATDYLEDQLRFYREALRRYDIFHFANAGGICFGFPLFGYFRDRYGAHSEIYLLKQLGKKIVYTNNGCLDGVSQTSFSKWGPESVCSICVWRNIPSVCSDERNLAWGKFRNDVADFQCLLGGNRVDYNDDPRVHEVPEVYCLDSNVWHPDLEVPDKFRLTYPSDVVKLYHAVGHAKLRTEDSGINIKSSHIYLPLVQRLKDEGHKVELMHFSDIPNIDLRFYQVQADIFLDMLTYGWFGATAREAMMLGKPVICFLRPEWLESARREIPEYVDELPIVSATPDTVYSVLMELIQNRGEREEIGRRSREFALKWHSADAGARRFDGIYSSLLRG